MNHEECRSLLRQFLSTSIQDGSKLLGLFASLPGAVVGSGERPLERFVYVPGSRKDRIVLVAHCDTVWDRVYGGDTETSLGEDESYFYSTNPSCGIGADDRAGCAMVWALRNSGHSLLIVDGEEHGKWGAKFLREHHGSLFRELNRHRYMLELDWQGAKGCLFHQVDNTAQFRNFVTNEMGFREDQVKGGCDLQFLCRRICGANLSVGYYRYHKPNEVLLISDWEQNYHALEAFLQKPQPLFLISGKVRCRKFFLRCRQKAGKILRKITNKT